MAHIQDRWYRPSFDPETGKPVLNSNGKQVTERTELFGKGLRYKVRYNDPNGNEHSRSFADKKLKAAKDFKSDQETLLASGKWSEPTSKKEVKVADFAKNWLCDLDIDELSRQQMEMRFRSRITPHFGAKNLKEVRPSAIRSWDRKLRDAGLSDRYRHTLFGNLSAMFTAAEEDGLIGSHPLKAKSVKQPRPKDGKVVPWLESQVWAVQGNLRERFRIAVDLGAGLGLRQGELLGLAVDDIDFENGIVHVVRQVKKVRYKHVFALPKYDKVRDVPMSEPVQAALSEHIRRFPSKAITLPWNTPDGKPHTARLVITSAWGNVVDAKDFNKDHWKPALKAADMPHGKYENGMHDLRHFFASVLLDSGESIKAVAEWLGHADPSFTLKTYTHLMPSSNQRTKSVISSLYGRRGPGTQSDGLDTASAAP